MKSGSAFGIALTRRANIDVVESLALFITLFKMKDRPSRQNKLLVNSFVNLLVEKCKNKADFMDMDDELVRLNCEKYLHKCLHAILLGQIEKEITKEYICLKKQFMRYSWIEVGDMQILFSAGLSLFYVGKVVNWLMLPG